MKKPKIAKAAIMAGRRMGKTSMAIEDLYTQIFAPTAPIEWWMNRNITDEHREEYPNARAAHELKQTKLWKVLA